MSKQRLARRVRRGARYAMERHQRNVRPQPLPLPGERTAGRTARSAIAWILTLAALIAVTAYARCGHAGPLEDLVDQTGAGWAGVGAFLAGILLGVVIVFGSWAACNLLDALRGIISYLFRKGR
jgi:sugar/nucleoside kinase (ribokinase family)